MPEQCYLIDDRLKFYFVPEDLHIEYKGKREELTKQEADVIKYMLENTNNEDLIRVDDILKANWLGKAEKKELMQLLFEFNKKCRNIGFNEQGFVLNGDSYRIDYHFVLIDGYRHQLEEVKAQKLSIRRLVFIVGALILALIFM